MRLIILSSSLFAFRISRLEATPPIILTVPNHLLQLLTLTRIMQMVSHRTATGTSVLSTALKLTVAPFNSLLPIHWPRATISLPGYKVRAVVFRFNKGIQTCHIFPLLRLGTEWLVYHLVATSRHIPKCPRLLGIVQTANPLLSQAVLRHVQLPQVPCHHPKTGPLPLLHLRNHPHNVRLPGRRIRPSHLQIAMPVPLIRTETGRRLVGR
jgi:hypothetical protein